MFGRKNQTILSSHYNKLVEQDETSEFNGEDNGSEEDFFSLKRADHDLPADPVEHSDLSKRKIRMMRSMKARAKSGPRGTKLVFDEDGQAHQLYEFKDMKDVDVERDGVEFMQKEIGKMQRADVDDKAVAKEKKREKKRKRKEREREEVRFTIAPFYGFVELNRSASSVVGTRDMLVSWSLLLQTTAMFPQHSISRQRQKTNERISPLRRRKNLAKRKSFQVRWRRKRNLRLNSYDDEDSYCISVRVTYNTSYLRT